MIASSTAFAPAPAATPSFAEPASVKVFQPSAVTKAASPISETAAP